MLCCRTFVQTVTFSTTLVAFSFSRVHLIIRKPFNNVESFKYFGTTVTDQMCVNKEIKNRFRKWLLPFGYFLLTNVIR
jgi:hypothetical protein